MVKFHLYELVVGRDKQCMIHSIVIIHPIKFHIEPSFPYFDSLLLLSFLRVSFHFFFFVTRNTITSKRTLFELSLGPIKGSIKIRVTEISLVRNGVPSVIHRIHV